MSCLFSLGALRPAYIMRKLKEKSTKTTVQIERTTKKRYSRLVSVVAIFYHMFYGFVLFLRVFMESVFKPPSLH